MPPRSAEDLIRSGYDMRRRGSLSEALLLYREAASIYKQSPQPLRFAHTIRHVADILRDNHLPEQALVHYEEALAIYREHSETRPLDLANTLRGFALAFEDLGRSKKALDIWREAKRLYLQVGVPAGIEESEQHLRVLTPNASIGPVVS